MKVQKIQFYTRNTGNSGQKATAWINSYINTPIPTTQNLKSFAYLDFNINFTGRTPENFYQQEFNKKNMPDSMKEYLNVDYNTRKHIPPEQMMNEVFKYIELADKLEDVKEIYPNEKLFKSLHENHQQNRTSILGEIKLAKEMSDEPLLKDGSDDLGLYILKKIYLNGKTIKEINKDFYEKDLNEAYKGILTQPIDTHTTAAYGIQFPKTPFWNSFIATREEYKKFFVTLPKNSINPATRIKHEENKTQSTISKKPNEKNIQNTKPRQRKYQIKDYQKRQITNDIKDAKGDIQEVEKKIRKRFAKDDPEASFIVKYLSPIMAIAADRVHLSEEMKAFCENEKINGQNNDDPYMFSRFWKKNPHLLNYYAQSITDTIDMFEDIYGEGGLIPINKDLEVVNSDSENQKVIDNVSTEFLDLLNYTQKISAERERKYQEHNEQQKLWDEYFINKYGTPTEEKEITNEPTTNKTETINTTEKELTPSVEETKQVENKPLKPAEIQKQFFNTVRKKAEIYPDIYAEKYLTYIQTNKEIDNEYKLAYLYYIGNRKTNDSLLTEKEFYDKFYNIEEKFIGENEIDSIIAKCAIVDMLSKLNYKDARLYSLNTYDLPNIDKGDKVFLPVIKQHKNELNRLYRSYQKPIKPTDIAQGIDEMMHQIEIYKKPQETVEDNSSTVLQMMHDAYKNPLRQRYIKEFLKTATQNNIPQLRLLLKKDNFTEEEQRGRFENVILPINADLIINSGLLLLIMVGKENFQNYVNALSDDIKMHLIKQELRMTSQQKEFYEITLNDVKNNPKLIDKFSFIDIDKKTKH